MGQRFLEILKVQKEGAAMQDYWSLVRALTAELQERPHLQAANSLPENIIAAIFWANGGLEISLLPDLPATARAMYLIEVFESEWPEALLLLYTELDAVRAFVASDEPEVHVAGLSAGMPAGAVGHR